MTDEERAVPADATVLRRPRSEGLLIWGGFPILGAVAGWFLPRFADWWAALPWAPMQGPAELVASLPPFPAAAGGAALGVVGGLLLALISEGEWVSVAVGGDQVLLTREDRTQYVSRAQASAVFVDGEALVVLGPATEELARQSGELPGTQRLRAVFESYGYPWSDGDPHAEDYRRWVDGHPALSAAAHALLRARAKALEKKDATDAEELRAELGALGVVVRDADGRQLWRPTSAVG